MKKKYERPTIEAENFMANEYCATCDNVAMISVSCDAGRYNYSESTLPDGIFAYALYRDSNGDSVIDPNTDHLWDPNCGSYRTCDATLTMPRDQVGDMNNYPRIYSEAFYLVPRYGEYGETFESDTSKYIPIVYWQDENGRSHLISGTHDSLTNYSKNFS